MEKRTRPRRARRARRAATRDVLGQPLAQPRIPPKWRPYYQRLLDLRAHLVSKQQDLTKDACEEQPSFSMHMADAATDNYDRDLALGLLSSEQDALWEIDEAISRIREGTYGTCELTGKPIEAGRLEAIPWTRFSAAAEKQLEREGAVKRSRLGPRETVTRVPRTKETD